MVIYLSCRRLYYRPSDADLDEFHPRATRTLYVGNLSTSSLQAVASSQSSSSSSTASASSKEDNPVKDKFSPFGEILEIDAKAKGGYACVQVWPTNQIFIECLIFTLQGLKQSNIGCAR